MADLFDTNILIDHLNGIAKATRELKRNGAPAFSMITSEIVGLMSQDLIWSACESYLVVRCQK